MLDIFTFRNLLNNFRILMKRNAFCIMNFGYKQTELTPQLRLSICFVFVLIEVSRISQVK